MAVPTGGLRQREPAAGAGATEQTDVLVVFDDRTLYIGIRAHDREPEAVLARCRRVGVVRHGRLAAEGTLEELRALVPAAALAVIQGLDPDAVRRRATERGYAHRDAAAGITVWLPRHRTLEEVAGEFHGVPLDAIMLRPVDLETVYAEVVRER